MLLVARCLFVCLQRWWIGTRRISAPAADFASSCFSFLPFFGRLRDIHILFVYLSSAMDSLSLRLCPPAAHPATTSSRSVLSICFVFFLFLQSLSARLFFLFFFSPWGFVLFLFLLFFGGMDYCGFHLLLLSSFGIPMLHWLSGIIYICVCFFGLFAVGFFVDFCVGSALAKW